MKKGVSINKIYSISSSEELSDDSSSSEPDVNSN